MGLLVTEHTHYILVWLYLSVVRDYISRIETFHKNEILT
jgi:hypothetical protein